MPDAANTVIQVDIPCDVQDEDELGMPYAILSEARDPSSIVETESEAIAYLRGRIAAHGAEGG